MPLIKVHICQTERPAINPILTKRLLEIMIECLHLDEKIGQVLLYEALPQYRAINKHRSNKFVFIEILMHFGRTKEIKALLMQSLVEETSKILQIDKKDINVCILEIHSDNWYGDINYI